MVLGGSCTPLDGDGERVTVRTDGFAPQKEDLRLRGHGGQRNRNTVHIALTKYWAFDFFTPYDVLFPVFKRGGRMSLTGLANE